MTKIHPSSVYPGGILTLDESLKISHTTPEFCDIFNCQPHEIVGQSLESLFSPKDRKGILVFHNKLSRYEKGFLDVIILLIINNQEFITRLRMIKQQEEWFAIVEDILSESDDLFREFQIGRERWTSIVRNSSEGIAMLDTEGRLVEFNIRFLELMQFRSTHGVLLNEDAIFNKKLFDLLDNHQFSDVQVAFEKAKIKKKLKFSKQIFYNHHYFKLELTPIYFPVQGFVGCSIVVKDITANKQLEAAHQEIIQINQVAKTVNSSLNVDQVINSINESLQTIFKFDRITIALIDQEEQHLSLYRTYQVTSQGINLEENKTIRLSKISILEHQNYWVQTFIQNQPNYIREVIPELAIPQESFNNVRGDSNLSLKFLKSAILYPLEVQDRVVGVLAFGRCHETLDLTEIQVIKIQNYVVQLATAINNAKLYEDLRSTKIQLAETEKIVALTTSLREKEKEYRNLVENINLGVYRNSIDSQGKILKANHALARMFGYTSVEELMQIPLSQLYVNSNDREKFLSILQHQGECRNFELLLKKKDGTPILTSVNATVQYDEQGRIKWCDGVIEDITERKKAEAEREKFTIELFQLNQAFSRFVPRQFLHYLEKSSIIDVELGDQVQLEMSVLFSDIRGFTALSEKMTPEENFQFINSYLSQMEPAITENQGFIDKYIGDSIMALFSGEADNAVKAGLAMLHQLAEYNQQRANSGLVPIQNGIGLNTGSLILGTVGGQNRMDGTVISDAVNLASRIENLTKEYGVSLLISQHTFSRLKKPTDYAIRQVDQVKVKGREELVTVYEVFDADRADVKEKKLATLQIYTEACSYYNLNAYAQAAQRFKDCLRQNPSDRVAQIYLKRCQDKLSST